MSRLTNVLGYPAGSLLGESFFTLIHTADIQNMQAAFIKCESQMKKLPIIIRLLLHKCHSSERARPVQKPTLSPSSSGRRLLLGANKVKIFVQHHICTILNFVLPRACCSSACRDTEKRRRISCQHFQITGVLERETIMASIQMLPSEKAKQRRALPTSVIVSSPPLPSPESPLPNSVGTTEKCQRRKAVKPTIPSEPHPNSVTDKVNGETPTDKTVLGQAKTNKGEAETSLTSNKPLSSTSSDHTSIEDLDDERDFFEMLFDFDSSNLDQLAPRNHQFDTLEETTTGGSDLLGPAIDINKIKNFCGSMSNSLSDKPSSTVSGENWFDLIEAPLLKPEEDVLWGRNRRGQSKREDVIWEDVRAKTEGKSSMKRKIFCSEEIEEPSQRVWVVQNTSDYNSCDRD